MQPGWKQRAIIWLALAESVRANRAQYPDLPTAWVPHGVGNSFALWLPELLAPLARALRLRGWASPDSTLGALERTARAVCIEQAAWGSYVAPAALGYVVSHPRFNIYRGRLGELAVGGFGLDAIPHGTTAFSLSCLLQDSLVTLAEALPPDAPLGLLVRPLARVPALFSGLVLVGLTVIWESGEYLTQQEELRRTGGDRSAINMQWDLRDTWHDLLSNAAGWLVAARRGGRSLLPPPFDETAPPD